MNDMAFTLKFSKNLTVGGISILFSTLNVTENEYEYSNEKLCFVFASDYFRI